MATVHRISPETWDESISMHADVIDELRSKHEVRHPAHQNMELLIHEMRKEFDDFAARWYGTPPPTYDTEAYAEYVEMCLMWYRALAIMTLDLKTEFTKKYQTDLESTARSLYPLLRRKMEDYGHDNIRRFGKDGLIVRLHDKLARLENLGRKKVVPSNEPVLDTMNDIIGYCLIGCMVETDEWELPMMDLHSDG